MKRKKTWSTKSDVLTIKNLEMSLMKEKRAQIYIACEEMDFIWDYNDVLKIDEMWNNGVNIYHIAKSFDRDPDEVLLLIIDRLRNNKIKQRPGGVFGIG